MQGRKRSRNHNETSASHYNMTSNDLTKLSVNKYDIESEMGIKHTINSIPSYRDDLEYMNYTIIELLEYDLHSSQHLHQDVDGQFSRVNGLGTPRPCKQVGLIIWLILSETYSIHLFMSGLRFYQNQYMVEPVQLHADGQSKQPLDISIIILFVIHTLIFVTLVTNGYLATVSDPTDKAIYYQRYYKDDLKRMDNIQSKLKYHCDICDLMIKDHTKHCRACNRCCDKFDHHCQWLNNCIGESNYRLFVISTSALALYVVQTMVIACYYIGKFKVHDFQFEIENFLICLQALFCTLILLASVQLLSWHFYFWRRGITTFTHIQFIKAKADKLKEVERGEITKAVYHEWLVDFDQNLERFKFESKIKKLVIRKKTSAVADLDAIKQKQMEKEKHQENDDRNTTSM